MTAIPHAIVRAKERLGLEIDIATLRHWAYLIRSDRARLVRRYASGCDMYEITHEARTFSLIFDPRERNGLGKVVTILDEFRPPDPVERMTKDGWRRWRRYMNKYKWQR